MGYISRDIAMDEASKPTRRVSITQGVNGVAKSIPAKPGYRSAGDKLIAPTSWNFAQGAVQLTSPTIHLNQLAEM